MKLPKQKLGDRTIGEKKDTGRLDLFGKNGIFGEKRLCAPQGSIEWCLQKSTLKYVPEALGIMGSSVCLSFSSIVIDGEGGAFRLELSIGLLQEALFRAAVQADCTTKSNKGICRWWIGLGSSENVEQATNEIVELWVKVRDEVFDKDDVEFSKTLNLGKMIKQLFDEEAITARRRLSNHDDIKHDGALCFGKCDNYDKAQVGSGSATVPVFIVSTLTWVFALFTL